LITIVFKNLKANALAFGKNLSSAIVYEINSRKDAKPQRLGLLSLRLCENSTCNPSFNDKNPTTLKQHSSALLIYLTKYTNNERKKLCKKARIV
jgi:hypothetical protein